MTPQIKDWIKKVKKEYINRSGKVLEVGSLDINGNVRDVFSDADNYTGIDSQEGKGVDKIVNSHDICKYWKPSSFDTVICLEMLEHDDKPWVTIEQLHNILKPNGILIITSPTFGFPIHRYPKDYFRYSEDAFRDIFFKGFEILSMEEVHDEKNSPGICCIGRKKIN